MSPLTRLTLIRALRTTKKEHQVEERGASVEMHDLVQLATRDRLEKQEQVARWRKLSLWIIASAYPSGQHETWAECRALLPHAQKVLSYDVEEQEPRFDRARITLNTASYLLRVAEYAAAEKIGRTAVVLCEKTPGREHPDTLASVDNLGLVLASQGIYEEAEAMHRGALEGKEKVLGVDHPDTLTSVNNLGLVRKRQGKYEEGEAMHRRALEGREKVLGREHPGTLTNVYNLAPLFDELQCCPTAAELYQRADEGYVKVLGAKHPTTVACLNHYESARKS